MKYKINILQMAYHADNENTRKVKTGTQMIMIIETILSFHRLLQSSVFNNMNKMFKVHKCLNTFNTCHIFIQFCVGNLV